MNNDVVIIQLDRPRQLKFGHTALKTLCELTGKTVEELDENGVVDLSDFDKTEKFAYCGLLNDAKANGESLTLEQMPELLDMAPNQLHIMEKLTEAWAATFGVNLDLEGNQGESVKKPTKGSRGTGKKASE